MREEARIALRLIMEYESEEAYAAGWLTDLEFILWARVLKRDKSNDEVADVLAWLAEEAGGWWCWSENADEGRDFVPLDRWSRRFAASQGAKYP
ncbi:MAG: hypothetical protein H0V62_06310 [Gammaproteobacteria bacterium]|nr:hypothetical protein [Gammaproteobacteria bacterium]